MIEVIPAIIPGNFKDLDEKIGLVVGKAPLVHIDVTDSTMTSMSSWPYKRADQEFEAMQREERGMPFWEDVAFEAHLMIEKPEEKLHEWITAGAQRIIVHVEAFEDPELLHNFIKDFRAGLSATPFLALELGLAMNFNTPIEKVLPFVLDVDFVQLMSIRAIGYQGNTFEDKTFDRIKELKAAFPETIIAVDGGVNLENASALLEAGVERLIVGSAIYGAEDPEEALEEFLNLKD